MGKEASGRRLTTFKQKMEVLEFLNLHLKETQEKRAGKSLWEYEEGWNDKKISDIVGCPEKTVEAVRKEMKGLLKGSPLGFPSERIEAIERRLVDVESILAEMREKHNLLCENLSISGVNVNHLRTIKKK